MAEPLKSKQAIVSQAGQAWTSIFLMISQLNYLGLGGEPIILWPGLGMPV